MARYRKKTELLDEARELGLDCDDSMSNEEIQAMLDNAEEAAEAGAAANNDEERGAAGEEKEPSTRVKRYRTLCTVICAGKTFKRGRKIALDAREAAHLIKQEAIEPV